MYPYQNNTNHATYDISGCNYPPYINEIIQRTIRSIKIYPLVSQMKLSKVRSGQFVLLQINFNIAINFMAKKYDIPLKLILPMNFPNSPPQIFIELSSGVGINEKNPNINPLTHAISTGTMQRWSSNNSINPILDEIRDSFSIKFPIYKKSSETKNTNLGFTRSNTLTVQNSQSFVNPQSSGFGNNPNMYYNNPMNQTNIYKHNLSSQTLNQYSGIYNQNIQPKSNPMSHSYPSTFSQTKVNVNNNSVNNTGSVNNNYQQNVNPNQLIKNELVLLIKSKIESKVNEEQKKILQQNNRLKYYKRIFNGELEKLSNITNSKNQIEQNLNKELEDIANKNNQIYSEINSNSEQNNITGENSMNFVNGNEFDFKLIDLISKEAYFEDLINAIKKIFTKENMTFDDALKYMRIASKNQLVVKFLRRQMLKQKI